MAFAFAGVFSGIPPQPTWPLHSFIPLQACLNTAAHAPYPAQAFFSPAPLPLQLLNPWYSLRFLQE